MSLTLTGPYDLTFSWKVSSESGYDYLRWYLDGRETAKISGTGGTWQNVSVSVPAGEHTIRWSYSKDPRYASGSYCVWVRVPKIFFPPRSFFFQSQQTGADTVLIHQVKRSAVFPCKRRCTLPGKQEFASAVSLNIGCNHCFFVTLKKFFFFGFQFFT